MQITADQAAFSAPSFSSLDPSPSLVTCVRAGSTHYPGREVGADSEPVLLLAQGRHTPVEVGEAEAEVGVITGGEVHAAEAAQY